MGSPRRPARMTENHSEPALIEIPAQEFANLSDSATSSSPPPARLCTFPRPVSRPWHRKQDEAAAARSASLEILRERCRHHVNHVVSVARVVKAERRAVSAARHAQLSTALADADARREKMLASRAAEAASARARRARVSRECEDARRRADASAAEQAREEAGRRRGRLLSARKDRASRFSPTRRLTSPPLLSFSPDRQHGNCRHSTSSISMGPRENSCTLKSVDSANSSNINFGTTGSLPSSVADDRPSSRIQSVEEMDLNASCEVGEVRGNQLRAARKIAGFYLLRKARLAMTAAGVLGEVVSTYSFSETTEHLKDEGPQLAVDLVFRALGMRRRDRSAASKKKARQQGERRVMLSSLLLALHPEFVVDDWMHWSRKAEPEALTDKMAVYCARRMLLCLHSGSICSVADAWVKWRRAFFAWKKKDFANLLKGMIEDAIATEEMRFAVVRRYAEAENLEEFKSAVFAEHEVSRLHRQERVIWEAQINEKQEKIRDAIIQLGGRAGEQKLDSALAAARSVRDDRMVHEIMVDLPGLLKRIRTSQVIPEVSWRRLHAELVTIPPLREELATRIANISKRLNSMIPGVFTLSSDEIPETLCGSFAIGLVTRVCESLKKCQPAAYDDALLEWLYEANVNLRSPHIPVVDAVVKCLKELTAFVDQVYSEVLTFRIQDCVPIVREFGLAWERSRFQGYLTSGVLDAELPNTKLLFKKTLLSAEHPTAFREALQSGAPNACRGLLSSSVIDLVMKSSACSAQDVPEVMHLDVSRIVGMQNEAQKCSLIGSLDNVSRQFLHAKGISQEMDDIVTLIAVVDSDDSKLVHLQNAFIAMIERSLKRADQSLAQNERDLLRGMVQRVSRLEDKTFALMHRRVKVILTRLCEIFENRLTSQKRVEGQGVSLSLKNLGLGAVEENLQKLGHKISNLVAHLLAVHGDLVGGLSKAVLRLQK